jgi:multidrug efflux pump
MCTLSAPEGTAYDYMDNYVEKVTTFMLDSVPEKSTVLSITAPGFASGATNSGIVRVALVDPEDRIRSQKEIVNMVNRNMAKFNEGRAFAIEQQTISVNRRGGQPVQFVVQNNNFDKLTEVLPKFLEIANANPVFQGVDLDLKFNKPELRINVNRLKASELGINVQEVSQTLQMALVIAVQVTSQKKENNTEYISRLHEVIRDDPADLKNLFVRNSRGEMISLDNLVTYEEATTPSNIYHFNRFKSATLSAGLAPGKTIGDGIARNAKNR